MPLSSAQLAVLKSAIAANTALIPAGFSWSGAFVGQAINVLPNSTDANFAIAGWYGLDVSPDFIVWRDVPMETVLDTITFANMTPLDAVPTADALAVAIWQARSLSCQGKQFNLQNLTIGRQMAPMKRASYRSAMQDCLTNLPAGASGANIAANWVGVRDAAKFKANNLEKLFATGTGSTASPADLVVEGTTDANEVQNARNLP